MPRILDNVQHPGSQLGVSLQEVFRQYRTVDIATGYVDLRGWDVFASLVDDKPRSAGDRATARVLVGMVAPSESVAILESLQSEVQPPQVGADVADREKATRRKQQLVKHLRTQLMRGLATEAGRRSLRRLKEQLASGAVEMRVFTPQPLHGKTYIFEDPGNVTARRWAYVGSSNLTAAGLYRNLELNVDVGDQDAATKLAGWFEDRWSDPFSLPITSEVIGLIEESWAGRQPSPFEVYLKVCHALSGDAREGMGYVLPASMRNLLLGYQETAVRTLARRIVRVGGTMLGDVVGLGKTITAIATALMLQSAEDYSTLVLCPKNLEDMWVKHLDSFGVTGTVVPYSMADRKLPDLRRYQLVICDESHNLRNTTTKAYQAIQEYIRHNNSKVLLLTATPYNVAFSDVAAQIGLYVGEDDDLGISPAAALAKDPGLAAKIDGKINTLAAFRRSEEPEDWQRLMSEHLIRRTRTFVQRLAVTDETGRRYMHFANGDKFYFPTRVPRPLRHSFAADDPAALMESDDTITAIANLSLPRYRLADYDNPMAVHNDQDKTILDNIRTGRGNVSGFVRKGLFKRLSSSGHSFVLSLQRQRDRNQLYLYAIDHHLPLPIGALTDQQLALTQTSAETDSDVEADTPLGSIEHRYRELQANPPTGTSWVNSTVFKPSLRSDLARDTDTITTLLDSFGAWDPARDSKINALVNLLTGPHVNDKVLVFTEYKDTATYVAEALHRAGIPHVGLATGDSDDPTAIARRFSPLSNRLPGHDETAEVDDPIHVLVATDVLSEGQNLQDAHVIVNYDLPWGLIRLVQRAGRVDRIGQTSPTVEIYTITHDRIEDEIHLRERVGRRLRESANAFGSDEQFFGTPEETHLIEGIYNGQLPDGADDTDTEVDAVSEAWLTWSNAQERFPQIAARALRLPDLVHSTRHQYAREQSGGVVSFVSTASGIDAFALATVHPTTGARAHRLLTATEALRYFAAEPDTPTADERPDQFDLQRELLQGPLSVETVAAGNLKGIRKWVWQRLSGTLFAQDAGPGLDALYEAPLTEHAANRFLSARRTGWSEADIAAEVARLHTDERLVIRATDTDTIRLVCSIGITD